ncbi:hypothetical protein KY358_02240 [Candidatus Woesearchaeota archaeon]|nr:hypothetical protein [Candidatus Woesearchaeota archaeon]
MALTKITGMIIILFGFFIGLTYFNIVPGTIFGYDFIMVGVIIFILHEAHALIRNSLSDTNKIVSVGVPLIFMITAGSYPARGFFPEAIASSIPLVISAFMVSEGLYRLH